MRHKKGIELSMNFFVTLIIALVIFSLGVRFIYNLTASATGLEKLTVGQLDERIGQLLCDSTDRVCIGIDRKTIEKGKFSVFGVKVINIFDGRNFEVNVKTAGYTLNNGPILTDAIILDKVTTKYREDVFLERNKEKSLGIAVEIAKEAQGGIYILDINISHDVGTRFETYGGLHKLYVEVP